MAIKDCCKIGVTVGALVGGLLGNLLFPGAGGIVGGLLGAGFDQLVTFPLLSRSKQSTGPKLDDIDVQRGSEGSEIKFVIGPKNRVAGTVIWASEPYFEKKTRKVGPSVGGSKVTERVWFVDVSIAVCSLDTVDATKVRIRKAWASSKLMWDDGVESFESYEEFNVHKGSDIDSVIESHKGAGNVPLYKKMLRVTIKKLALAQFGSMPNMTFLVEQDADVSVGDAIALMMLRGGYTASQFDVTRLSQCFRGRVISGSPSTGDVVREVMLAYGVAAQDRGDKIVFIERGEEDIVPVQYTTVGSLGSPKRRNLVRVDPTKTLLPREVVIRYIAEDFDLQRGAENFPVQQGGGEDALVIDLQLTMSSSQALAVAKRVAWTLLNERQRITASLFIDDMHAMPGDVLRTGDGDVYVTRASSLANGVIDIEGTSYDADAWSQVAPSGVPGLIASQYIPPNLEFAIFNMRALDATTGSGLAVAVTSAGTWKGASVLASDDEVLKVSSRATMGWSTSPLGPGPYWVWDTVSYLDVELTYGTPTSGTDDEAMQGERMLAVEHLNGWELVGYVTVTPLGGRSFRFSRLIRGLRSTEHLIKGHKAGRAVVLLNFAVQHLDRSINNTENYKVVPVGADPDDYDAIEITCDGTGVQCSSVANLSATYNVDDMVITWQRRARVPVAVLTGGPLQPNETPERYKLEFRAGGPLATVKRSTEVLITTYTYTWADRSADGFASAAAPVHCTVKQLGQINSEPIMEVFTK